MNEEHLESVRELLYSVKDGDIGKVKTLLAENESLLWEETFLGTWVHSAANFGQLEVMKALIDAGISVNSESQPDGKKPICMAVASGHQNVVEFLISVDCDLDVHASVVNPLFYAIIEGQELIAEMLVEAGIDIHKKYHTSTMDGMDAMSFAEEYGRDSIVSLLERATGRPS